MLKGYRTVINDLTVAERKLLMEQIQELKRVMKPGFSRLNWNSLGIPDFISRCNQVCQGRRIEWLIDSCRK